VGHANEGTSSIIKTQSDINTQHSTFSNILKPFLLVVNPATAYHVVGSVFGKDFRFMLDTGAAISLISDRM